MMGSKAATAFGTYRSPFFYTKHIGYLCYILLDRLPLARFTPNKTHNSINNHDQRILQQTTENRNSYVLSELLIAFVHPHGFFQKGANGGESRL